MFAAYMFAVIFVGALDLRFKAESEYKWLMDQVAVGLAHKF